MPLIMNSLDETKTTYITGNYFTFKPNQIRQLHNPDVANLIARQRADEGFVALPEVFQDPVTGEEIEYPDWTKTEAGKALIEEKRKQGVESYCQKLREVVYNLQVSLRGDLERNNIKADPRVFASNGEIHAMEQLVKYQSKKEDQAQVKIDKLKELERKLEPMKK